MKTIKDAHFVPHWIDMKPMVPEPRIDWITKKFLDLAYGEDPLQKLDLYLPQCEGPVPLVILVHGGGWCYGDKRDWHLYPGFYALEKGFALASVNYQLTPAAKFPDPVEDLKAAIRFLRKNAEKYGFRKEDIFLYGTSAGGHLVTLAGLQNAGSAEKVAAVAALCPLVDFENQWKYWNAFEIIAPDYVALSRSQLKPFLGTTPDEDVSIVRNAGAQKYITKDAPSFYIQHGTMDPAVPVEQGYTLAHQIRKVCGEDTVVLDLIDGAGHAGGGPEFLEKEHIVPIFDFFLRLCIGR